MINLIEIVDKREKKTEQYSFCMPESMRKLNLYYQFCTLVHDENGETNRKGLETGFIFLNRKYRLGSKNKYRAINSHCQLP